MKLVLPFVFFFVISGLTFNAALSQQINLYSITNARQAGGDNGYTLDGARMVSSRAKLLNADNFGDNGTYAKKIFITDDFPNTGSFTALGQYPDIDILFIGSFNKLDPALHQFSNAELDTLYQWSKRGGKLIIAPQASLSGSWDFTEFDSRWGFSMFAEASSFLPTTEGNNSEIFNGAFGTVSSANQGGGAQGYFKVLPQNAVVLAKNGNGQPTLFLDCNTFDLICADVDGFTDLGDISFGSLVSNQQDRFWLNTITYMDKLEAGIPPVISLSDNVFSTGSYPAYQWFRDGIAINGATNNSYAATDSGEYAVEVTYTCGCTAMSSIINLEAPSDTTNLIEDCELLLPLAFSPNGDGKNDKLKIIGNGLANFSSFNFEIFNRWGEKVFETAKADQEWDGTFNRKNQPAGVFFYVLEGICSNTGKKISRQGSVTLVR